MHDRGCTDRARSAGFISPTVACDHIATFWLLYAAAPCYQIATWRLSISTDRIEKKIVLRAPLARVWRALTDAGQFGTWFGAKLDGTFAEGATIRGHITSPGYEHVKVELQIERIVPQQLFSYRWHPYAIDASVDYSNEPPTLVEFRLEETAGGTQLTVVESGFDRLPPSRRAEAFRMNEGGWSAQLTNIDRHVTTS
jgi:uncharacterized protein YndB with AHSA1/START domain